MGDLMRQYWMPALASHELPAPDGRPLRVRLLGEKLIAFRDTTGQVGLLANNCPHRGASLFFGRNEEERPALRLPRLEVRRRPAPASTCPTSRPRATSRTRSAPRPTPASERGGIIWAYMGPRADAAAAARPRSQHAARRPVHVIGIVQRECNWMQALEGDIDTSHVGFLHLGARPAGGYGARAASDYYALQRSRAALSRSSTPSTARSYGAYRPAEPDTYYWRIAHFLFPFYTMIPAGVLGRKVSRPRLGADGRRAHDVSGLSAPKRAAPAAAQSAGDGRRPSSASGCLPNTTDWLGRFRLAANAEQRLSRLDREKQRSRSYTGIAGISPAGPGGHGEHGGDLRSVVRASGHHGPDDHSARAGASSRRPGRCETSGSAARRGSSRGVSLALRGDRRC